jgi:UDP-N-acetylglucosamine 2-epimerase (non-hydrolysing)
VAHVEAGLRTGNIRSPWPEEANRLFISRIAQYHFAPTDVNRDNLLRENIPSGKIFVTGNTVIDALMFAVRKARRSPPPLPVLHKALGKTGLEEGIVLITGHRRENFGDGFVSICKAIEMLAKRFPNVQFVYPVHLNPNVRNVVMRMLGGEQSGRRPGNIRLIEPLPYLPFISLMDRCRLVLTDSGGIQEEAPGLGKPVIVMRDTTERPEAVKAGTAKLVGTNTSAIVREVTRLLTDEVKYRKMAHAHNPYGDGRASARIVDILLKNHQQ